MTAREKILNRVRSALNRKVSPGDTATIDAHIAAHPLGMQPPRDWEPELRFRARAEALASTVEKVSEAGTSLDAITADVYPFPATDLIEISSLITNRIPAWTITIRQKTT